MLPDCTELHWLTALYPNRLLHPFSGASFLQLLGCRGALAEREAGNIFATPARIHQIPNHAE
jgi:hypothetical protein